MSDPAEVVREALRYYGGTIPTDPGPLNDALVALKSLVDERDRLGEDLNEAISTMLETAAERDRSRAQLDRVKALADKWSTFGVSLNAQSVASQIRTALTEQDEA